MRARDCARRPPRRPAPLGHTTLQTRRCPATEGLRATPFSALAKSDDELIRIAVAGEVDMATSLNLEVVLMVTIETTTARRVTVDLAGVTFIDATGVDALVAGHEAARRCGVGFTVENARGIVLRVFDVLGLTEYLHQASARP